MLNFTLKNQIKILLTDDMKSQVIAIHFLSSKNKYLHIFKIPKI